MVIKLKKKERNLKGELCGWAVKSHKGNKILGRFTTKEKAEKWLKQIELFKHMKQNNVKLKNESIEDIQEKETPTEKRAIIKLNKPVKNSNGEICYWGVKSLVTGKILAHLPTKKRAEERLREIEKFKYMNKYKSLRENLSSLNIHNQHYELFYKQKNKNNSTKQTIKFSPEVDKERQILKVKNNPNLTNEEKEKEIAIIKAKYNKI